MYNILNQVEQVQFFKLFYDRFRLYNYNMLLQKHFFTMYTECCEAATTDSVSNPSTHCMIHFIYGLGLLISLLGGILAEDCSRSELKINQFHELTETGLSEEKKDWQKNVYIWKIFEGDFRSGIRYQILYF